jgi:anti-anti-sigma factor
MSHSATPVSTESFEIHRHGDIVVLVPSPDVENMSDNTIEQAAALVLSPLKEDPPAGLIIDLAGVNYFGSMFITFLMRCHLLMHKHGHPGELVLAGVSDRVRELLRMTNLDTLWALYDSRAEALEALGSY